MNKFFSSQVMHFYNSIKRVVNIADFQLGPLLRCRPISMWVRRYKLNCHFWVNWSYSIKTVISDEQPLKNSSCSHHLLICAEHWLIAKCCLLQQYILLNVFSAVWTEGTSQFISFENVKSCLLRFVRV